MKKSCFVGAFAVIALALCGTGCSSINTSDSTRIADIGTNPVRYELETSVDNHLVRGEASHSSLFGLLSWGDDDFADGAFVHTDTGSAVESLAALSTGLLPGAGAYDNVKKAASYNACKSCDAYTLVGARYEITTSNYLIFKRISCTVTGFPVKVLGAKRVTEKNK